LNNAAVRQQLSNTSLFTIALIFFLYLCTIGALMLVTNSTLRLCGITIDKKENLLLNCYTTVINFFGPLQSGPAFRAAYLKGKYKLSLKKYVVATLLYYIFFAIISGVFLLSGILQWWLIPLCIVGFLILYKITRIERFKSRLNELNYDKWYYLALATLLQLSIVATIYYVELHTLSSSITVSQAIIYTGAANFALFVSITPGAIGFREAFLVLSRHLHHINGSLIVSANILDRTIYLLLLIFLAIFIVSTHVKNQLTSNVQKD
jgi:uncharacterized membrane protein YbhN (UPF0104 family)